MSSAVKPCAGWVLIHRPVPGETTAGGIVVPEVVRAKARGITPGEASKATCVAVGDGVTCCQPGDTVFVLAQNDNLVPVVTDEFGQVEKQNGFMVPEYFLFKASAIAGVISEFERGPVVSGRDYVCRTNEEQP